MLTSGDGGSDDVGAREIADDRLRLMFTCCHPALSIDAQVALTLRTLPGRTTTEIARAFLVSSDTMAKRLVRAKHKIRDAGIPYRIPPPDQFPGRMVAVLAVLYALFNEGYSASAGADIIRQNLCLEAIRLARLLAELMPGEPEVSGLLALMVLHHSRSPARIDAAGDLVTLEDQDRSRWDHTAINEACSILGTAARDGAPGPYQIMAAIAAVHATARTWDATRWVEIAALYERLIAIVPTPIVALNRAVAVAMADGPQAGLQLVEQLEASGALAGYHLLPATRADLLRRLGYGELAVVAYRDALELAPTEAERRFLTRRIVESSTAH